MVPFADVKPAVYTDEDMLVAMLLDKEKETAKGVKVVITEQADCNGNPVGVRGQRGDREV